MPGETADTSFLDKYEVTPPGSDASFLDKYEIKSPAGTLAPLPKVNMKGVAGLVPAEMYREHGIEEKLPPRLDSPLMPMGAGMIKPLRMATSIAGNWAGSKVGDILADQLDFSPTARAWTRDIAGLGGSLLGFNRSAPAKTEPIEPGLPTTPKVRSPESIPPAAMPARTPSVGASPLEPRPEVVTAPAKPPSMRSLMNRLGQQIEDVAKHPAVEPTAKAVPARGTVGAKTVTEEPNTSLSGPKIQTPSRSETMTENLKNRVPGSNPLEPRVKLGEQPPSPARTPAEVKSEEVHPMTRQSIHVNGAQATELTEGKPELRNDLLDLEGEQLREVLRKSGEDMTHIQTVGKSAGKAARGGSVTDPNNISRQEAFDMLFEKGYTPEQIVKEAPPRSKPAPIRKPFGPPLQNPLAPKESGL
jgi:hypothetical protein